MTARPLRAARGGVGRRGDARRLVVLAAFAAFGLFWGAWGAVLPGVQSAARATDGQLGSALLLIGLGALASMRLTGALIDRAGRLVAPGALLAFGAAGFLPALARGPGGLDAALLVLGVAAGAADVAINTAAVDAEARGGRPILNLAHATFSGAVVTASLGAGLARGLGFGPRAVLGGAAVVIAAVAATIATVGGAGDEPERTPRRRTSRGLRVFLRRPVPIFGALAAMAYLVENAWQSWGAVHLRQTLHSSAAMAALAPACFAAAAFAGRLSGHRLPPAVSARRVLVVGALTAAAGTVVAALAPTIGVALAGIVVAGLGTSVCAPTLISLAGRSAGGGDTGSIVGAVTTLAYLGFLIGPAAVGLVADATTLRTALVMVAAAAFALAVFARAARTTRV